jgi:hypothetical protein
VKLLETLRIRAASAVRRQRARVGLGDRPARIDVRLDDFDADGVVVGAPLVIEAWQDRLVELIQWAGPVPTRLVAEAAHPLLADLVRFCHRLEMPVTVRIGPTGLDNARATELIDRGMARCELVVDALEGAGEAAVRALVHGRNSRAANLTVHVHLRVSEAGAAGASGAFEAARALGVDAVVLAAPFRGPALSAGARTAVQSALAVGWPLQATSPVAVEALPRLDGAGPGAPRRSGHCHLGGIRLALASDGVAYICPHKAGRAPGPLAESAAALADHRRQIRGCDRHCAHPELL